MVDVNLSIQLASAFFLHEGVFPLEENVKLNVNYWQT